MNRNPDPEIQHQNIPEIFPVSPPEIKPTDQPLHPERPDEDNNE